MTLARPPIRRGARRSTAGEPSLGYRSFFENAVEGMYRTTLDGRYLDVNPALARMHGCETPEAFIGHFRNASVRTYVDPASREELVRQMRDQGYVRSLESEAYRRDGSRFWISVTGHPLWDDEGQLVGYECFVVDITDRRRMQDAVRESELHKSAAAAVAFAGWEFDLTDRRLVSPSGVEVKLTKSEFNLLAAFVAAPNRVLSRGELLSLSRKYGDEILERSIDIQIFRLRQKIEESGKDVQLIKTQTGAGYIFTPEVKPIR